MVQLYIDYSNNKIIGYNKIIHELNENYIFVEDSEAEILYKGLDNLYYIDGKIVTKTDSTDTYYSDLDSLNKEMSEAVSLVNDEYKLFMDNIISNGMTVEEASKISKENRDKKEKIQSKIDTLVAKHKEDIYNAIDSKFKAEEEAINYKYFLSMVSIVRDENEYLKEWMDYHFNLGFDHFYIYDNESEIPVKEYLESINYENIDKVTIVDWKTTDWSQQDAYNNWLQTYGKESKWFLGADPDEFVYIKDTSKTLIEFLTENSDVTSIKCLWLHFNANGHETKTSDPVMERFTTSTDWDDYKHGGKKFSQSNRILRFRSYVPISKIAEAKEFDYEDSVVNEYFRLNHYYTKSYEEWVDKIKRGSSNPNFRRKYSEFFELNSDMEYLNTGEDFEQGYGSTEESNNETTDSEKIETDDKEIVDSKENINEIKKEEK